MLSQLWVAVALAVSANALFDKNLAYRSPFIGYEDVGYIILSHDAAPLRNALRQFSVNTRALEKRHIEHVKRQTLPDIPGAEAAASFDDEHYPTFYGGDFSNVSTFMLCKLAMGD